MPFLTPTLMTWICVVSFLLLSLALCLPHHQKRRQKEYRDVVINFSRQYQYVLVKNKEYPFFLFDDQLTFSEILSSKQQFDNFDYIAFFQHMCEIHKEEILHADSLAHENEQRNYVYFSELAQMPPAFSHEEAKQFHLNPRRLLTVEKELVRDIIQQEPVMNVSIGCSANYVSAKGRNHYHHSETFSMSEVYDALERNRLAEIRKRNYSNQRKLMNVSLRYDVLRRDQFHCVICGRGAEDGVKLHVDHICPVSKGGKTELSNLRTLCEACNLGKSDKYEDFGLW